MQQLAQEEKLSQRLRVTSLQVPLARMKAVGSTDEPNMRQKSFNQEEGGGHKEEPLRRMAAVSQQESLKRMAAVSGSLDFSCPDQDDNDGGCKYQVPGRADLRAELSAKRLQRELAVKDTLESDVDEGLESEGEKTISYEI